MAASASNTSDLLLLADLLSNDTYEGGVDGGSNSSGGGGNGSSLCSNLTPDSDAVAQQCKFWIQGVLLCAVGAVGMAGNLVSLYVLSRPEMLSVFNLILVTMTAFDTVYLATSIAEFAVVETFHLTSEFYDKLFVYFLYPLHNITLCCSIYSHVVLAFERYLAVCHPELVYSTQAKQSAAARNRNNAAIRAEENGGRKGNNHEENEELVAGGIKKSPSANGNCKIPNKKRANAAVARPSPAAAKAIRKKVLLYVVPVILLSVGVNLPRWFELELQEYEVTPAAVENENSTATEDEDEYGEFGNGSSSSERLVVVGIAGTWLRYNQYYVTYYLHWTILLVTGILPLAAMAYLNTRIYLRIKEVQKVRTAVVQNRSEPNYAATLASIVVVFVVCHLPRVIKNVFEVVVTNKVIASGQSCAGINPAKCLSNLNNFILALNAASSFVVYCFVGTFGQKFMEVLRRDCEDAFGQCCCGRGCGGAHAQSTRVARVAATIRRWTANGGAADGSEPNRGGDVVGTERKNSSSSCRSTSSSPHDSLGAAGVGRATSVTGGHRLRRLRDVSEREARHHKAEEITQV